MKYEKNEKDLNYVILYVLFKNVDIDIIIITCVQHVYIWLSSTDAILIGMMFHMPLYNKQKYNTNRTHFIVTKLSKIIIIGLSGQALPPVATQKTSGCFSLTHAVSFIFTFTECLFEYMLGTL